VTTTLARLHELGITLPAAPSPAASYVQTRAVAIGDGRSLLYVAGQISREGNDVMTGRCPDETLLAAFLDECLAPHERARV
jgi:hypothetical protein